MSLLDQAKAAYAALEAEDRVAIKQWQYEEDLRLLQGKQQPVFKLVAVSNFNRDYWDETERSARFSNKEHAQKRADYLNNQNGMHSEEFWVVKPADYQLKKGSDQL